MVRSNNPTLFFGAIGVAVIAVALSVYYIIPGYSHILVTHDPMAGHPTHALGFAAIAVVCIIAALVNRPK
ncbi:MAG: hypothetical protein JO202_04930 [Ktedonobacteraceae bacterium]|jgi:glucose dehydrogenase|nr:hypothetical protein [Ktedonobacteraceae bacterium]